MRLKLPCVPIGCGKTSESPRCTLAPVCLLVEAGFMTVLGLGGIAATVYMLGSDHYSSGALTAVGVMWSGVVGVINYIRNLFSAANLGQKVDRVETKTDTAAEAAGVAAKKASVTAERVDHTATVLAEKIDENTAITKEVKTIANGNSDKRAEAERAAGVAEGKLETVAAVLPEILSKVPTAINFEVPKPA